MRPVFSTQLSNNILFCTVIAGGSSELLTTEDLEMLLRTPYPTPPLDMNILSGAFFFLSIISLLKLKLLVHVRLSLFSASFWESVLMNAFKIGRIILIIVFFAFLCKICHCDSQLASSSKDNLTLAAKIKGMCVCTKLNQ